MNTKITPKSPVEAILARFAGNPEVLGIYEVDNLDGDGPEGEVPTLFADGSARVFLHWAGTDPSPPRKIPFQVNSPSGIEMEWEMRPIGTFFCSPSVEGVFQMWQAFEANGRGSRPIKE